MPKPNIKVAIKSCHAFEDRRRAQLDTWLQNLDNDFFFVVGRRHDGMVVMPDAITADVSDDFENIAPKIIVACKYALEENTDNLFVCDDDTYVVPERLLDSGFANGEYIGFMRTSGLDYNKGVPYAQGSAYWLSARSMEWVLRNQHILCNGIIDDGAVGQALIDHVPFTHDWRYNPGPVPERIPLKGNNLISTHKCLPKSMRFVHEQWRRSQ